MKQYKMLTNNKKKKIINIYIERQSVRVPEQFYLDMLLGKYYYDYRAFLIFMEYVRYVRQ